MGSLWLARERWCSALCAMEGSLGASTRDVSSTMEARATQWRRATLRPSSALAASCTTLGWRGSNEQGRLKRTRYLHEVHHARAVKQPDGTRCPDPRGGQLHQGANHRSRQSSYPGKGKRADYILYYKPNIPIAIIEAKDNNHSVGDGMQQALDYATTLRHPFRIFVERRRLRFSRPHGTGKEIESPISLGRVSLAAMHLGEVPAWKGLTAEDEQIVLQEYFDDGSGKAPRYYQVNAINATIEAIAEGRDRILLVMATGTGKTYTAFQIIWRLWKAGARKRILFLADRNVLIDQTMVNDFRPFGAAMAKLSTEQKPSSERTERPRRLTRRGQEAPHRTAYEIYLGLYQAITGPEERQKIFREFSPGFFRSDRHRRVSSWQCCRRLGLARDPRILLERHADRYDCHSEGDKVRFKHRLFRDPVYSYSLKQGIQDGFLAPYKVIKVHIDHDVEGYRPELGKVDRDGRHVEDRIYNKKDFDRTLVIDDRTKLVARRISEFLKESGDRIQKTIVFCVDEEHAARMRQALVNENKDLCDENHRYVMRITGSDTEGQAQLGNFIDPKSSYPVIVTTSRLLSTGVDAQTCRVIVLDRPVGSMTEFKQISGVERASMKTLKSSIFTLIDFRGATSHFADPDFDGEPVQIYEPKDDGPITPPDCVAATSLVGADRRP